jgi:hypothetical protein
VQSQINKDTDQSTKAKKGDKEERQMAPISNAFTLNIKNERHEVLKNMENLRKSVKLKKRANPLEKIITKLMVRDCEPDTTPEFKDTSKQQSSGKD